MDELDVVLPVLDLVEKNPVARDAVRRLVSTRAGARLPFIHRALLGMRAFDLHDVDAERGEIGFGGVREVIFGAGWLKLFHKEIAAAIGDDAKDALLYRIATQGTTWEIQEVLKDMRWIPSALRDAIAERRLMESVRSDARLGRLFRHITREVSRLIITEGGWGNVVEYAFERDPIRVVMTETMEAKMLGAATKPTCVITAGGTAGYLIGLTGDRYDAREVRCVSVSGGSTCEFEVTRSA